MTKKSLSAEALLVVEGYRKFAFHNAFSRVPYFNNKTVRSRGALRAYTGKGSPKDIYEEVETLVKKSHTNPDTVSNEFLKEILNENNLGIDCSGFAFHVLDAEIRSRGSDLLGKNIKFIYAAGITGKFRSLLRPAENCDVATLANTANSIKISPKEVLPGDMITMQGNNTEKIRDHILVVTDVFYENEKAVEIGYAHAVSYPEKGLDSGVEEGRIALDGQSEDIISGTWSENGVSGELLPLYLRAKNSNTELRRLNAFLRK